MTYMSIIESIRNFILTCDFLENYVVNVDYLENSFSYSIDPLVSEPYIQKFVDGGGKKQFQFSLTSQEAYDSSVLQNISNSGFYEEFSDWIETQDKNKSFPLLEDPKKEAIKIEVMTNGYLFDNDVDFARYQIQIRLIYKQEV